MSLTSYQTMKKTYFYNFYPTKAEEEEEEEETATTARVNQSSVGGIRRPRMLVEVRDVHPPPVLDPQNPWQIRKVLGHYEIASGRIVVSFQDAFDHILRYWNFCMANHVAMLGHKVAVVVWDVTNERKPRKYEGSEVNFQFTQSESYILACLELMRNRSLKVDDCVGLFWDVRESNFYFKLLHTK